MAAWPVAQSRYWVYPLQTVVTGGLLLWWWPRWRLQAPRLGWGVAIGVAALGVWLLPRSTWAAQPRLEGFDPWFFSGPVARWGGLALRFVRLVIVVPLAEEIFWRGFLPRWLLNIDFLRVPVGRFTAWTFTVTTVGFCLEHTLPDWPAALITGLLYNGLAWRTGSLSTCVLAHAVTNALLGGWVLWSGEWGYW